MSDLMELICIIGRGGSGKTQASRALENFGYYRLDNIPIALLLDSVALFLRSNNKIQKLAIVINPQTAKEIKNFREVWSKIKEDKRINSMLWFLEASEEKLINRYEETKSGHPWSGGGESKNTLLESIRAEYSAINEFKSQSDLILDTSDFNVHQLRDFVERSCNIERQLKIDLISFGFKFGLPKNINLLFDVRFLDNPYYDPKLRSLSGLDEAVYKSVVNSDSAKNFLNKLCEMLDYLIPLYHNEGRIFLNIGIGCTGGQHRSVSITRYLHRYLSEKKLDVSIQHRDSKEW